LRCKSDRIVSKFKWITLDFYTMIKINKMICMIVYEIGSLELIRVM
jgi:hypothetical protein